MFLGWEGGIKETAIYLGSWFVLSWIIVNKRVKLVFLHSIKINNLIKIIFQKIKKF